MVEEVLGEVAVRVDDAHALALADVLEDEVSQERGLARAGLADDVDVLAAVDAHRRAIVA